MTKITKEQILKIAKLSRIRLADEGEITRLHEGVSATLDWVEELSEVNTDNVVPMIGVENKLRLAKDEVSDGDYVEDVLKNASSRKYDFFAVPKVISES
jgi:aspartyl-tRNA(Asn)/glutamyl-tRNA(Gln) amidotransferase subunit C